LRLLVAALVVGLAVTAGFASRANAAGSKICPSDASPSCFGVTLSPSFVTLGGSGVAVATFTNFARSSATHTSISLTLSAGASPVSITSSPSANCLLATLSCDFGKVGGGNTARVFVRFTVTSPVSSLVANGLLSFDEGNDNTGTPTNDTINASSNRIGVSQSLAIVGDCTDGGSHLNASTHTQSISVVYPAADASLGLPCTPASAGVLDTVLPGFTQNTVFADLPLLSGPGVATAIVNFTTVPAGFTYLTVQLFEIPAVGSPFVVQNCVGGAIPSGQDSCIQSRAPFGVNGVSFTLLVLGTGVDPAWAF
jgi:hypothetical protein